MKQKYSALTLSFTFLSGLILLFIIAPLVAMILKTSPSAVSDAAVNPEVQQSILLTLLTSCITTLLFSLAAVPFAYLLARKKIPAHRFISGIVDLPVVIPHTAAGIAILGIISRDTLLGKAGALAGLEFVGHPAGIALAMAFVSIPFLINAARDGFEAVPERYEKVALTLGASPFRAFFTISLPLAGKSILSGLILMFARGMSEFGAVVIVAYHPMITPVLIYEWFGAFGLKYARPLSVLFMLISLAFFILLRLLAKYRKNA